MPILMQLSSFATQLLKSNFNPFGVRGYRFVRLNSKVGTQLRMHISDNIFCSLIFFPHETKIMSYQIQWMTFMFNAVSICNNPFGVRGNGFGEKYFEWWYDFDFNESPQFKVFFLPQAYEFWPSALNVGIFPTVIIKQNCQWINPSFYEICSEGPGEVLDTVLEMSS